MRYLVYFIVALLLTSCGGMGPRVDGKTAQGFVGKSEQDLIAAWGQPDGVMQGTVKHVDIYRRETLTTSIPTTPAVGVNYARGGVPIMTAQNVPGMNTQVVSPTCVASFTIINGKVVAAQSVGAAC